VRGGLDDALEKLARRDELRRRAAGQAAGTPAAVTELVEAVAAVVARNPELAITMGVEGAGDPVLLTFAVDDGIVQVSADNPLSAQVTDATPTSPRHADFDLDLDPVVEPDEIYADEAAATTLLGHPDTDGETTRPAYDVPHPYEEFRRQQYASDPGGADVDRSDLDGGGTFEDTLSYRKKFGKPEAAYDPPTSTYDGPTAFARPAERRPQSPQYDEARYDQAQYDQARYDQARYDEARYDEARYDDEARYEAPPVPLQVPPQSRGDAHESQRGMPAPMPTPMPRGAEPEATELAAKRLAAMLREDPSLLQPNPHD
jgi:hypothetical protein